MTTSDLTAFLWDRQPKAAEIIGVLLYEALKDLPFLRNLGEKLLAETGSRLVDWIDHLGLPDGYLLAGEVWQTAIERQGFQKTTIHGQEYWVNDKGLFPPIANTTRARLAIKVDKVADFLVAQGLLGREIEGGFLELLRRAKVESGTTWEAYAVERHGYRGWVLPSPDANLAAKAIEHLERFRLRQRSFETDRDGFQHARQLIESAIQDLGRDRTCDLFFQAERDYWQSRNRAAQVQKLRQDRLGMGWANHDHHTYRSSRAHFADLISILTLLGFQKRERFYAGHNAGWGAQVLDQPWAGVVIFADVDLSQDELVGDFGESGLEPRVDLSTVGLWCQIHGEAFLQAGMHHLECQYDFDAACRQLQTEGVGSMAPFTNFEFLRQCFTEGERWAVIPERVEKGVAQGSITREQADSFLKNGAVGSHLEILERNDGYKGFNQTGISDIIRKTDPRLLKLSTSG